MSDAVVIRHFLTYSGIRPPARMIEPLDLGDLADLNIFVRARQDAETRLVGFEKMVCGAMELAHVYEWHPNGRPNSARITMGGEETHLSFDEDDHADE